MVILSKNLQIFSLKMVSVIVNSLFLNHWGTKILKKKNTVAKNNNFINLKHPLCVAIETRGNGLVIPSNSGIPDLFFANDGQITKQYIRSITLSALSPMPY